MSWASTCRRSEQRVDERPDHARLREDHQQGEKREDEDQRCEPVFLLAPDEPPELQKDVTGAHVFGCGSDRLSYAVMMRGFNTSGSSVLSEQRAPARRRALAASEAPFTAGSCPAGDYEVEASVFGRDGRARGTARHRMIVLPR